MKPFFISFLILVNFITFGQDSLKIVSWNLHLLPSPVFAKSKKKMRVDSIIHHFTKVDTTADLLLFQEVFHQKRRKQLISGIEKLYPYYTPVVNPAKGKPFKTNSGLITFSKTPIVQMKSIQYSECSGSDCMAFKGAQFIHTVWNNHALLVVNTHLNSEPPRTIALEQAQSILDDLIAGYIAQDIPIFIGGDFNINCSDTLNYQKLLHTFKTDNKEHKDLTDFHNVKTIENTLDYIFIYDEWLPQNLKLGRVFKYQIGPNWKDSDKKKIYGQTVGFSDHHPVMITFGYTS